VSRPRPKPAEITLPEAPPQLYLAWIAFTVTTEQKLRERPRLRSRASRAGFVTTPPAHAAHRVFLGPLTEQGEKALGEGVEVLAPILEGDGAELSAAADYLQGWGEWLGTLATTDDFERAAIILPAPEVAALGTAILRAIRDQLEQSG
jgi:hypothetical protein